MAPVVTMRQLLEAGVHFGHQTRRWNPKMKRYIFGERNGIYIIDLQQTLGLIEQAYGFVRDLVADGGRILFIGTKKQAQDPVRSYAEKCGMPYINERWLGGMLTNFETIAKRVDKMKEYERMRASGEFDAMPKKEALILGRELEKLERNLGGIRAMAKRPDAVFVIDTKKEHIAVTEANKLGIPWWPSSTPTVDPDLVQYVIPGNDDAIRSSMLMSRIIADAVEEGRFIANRRNPAVAAPAPTRRPRTRPGSPPSRPRPAARPPPPRPSARPAWPPAGPRRPLRASRRAAEPEAEAVGRGSVGTEAPTSPRSTARSPPSRRAPASRPPDGRQPPPRPPVAAEASAATDAPRPRTPSRSCRLGRRAEAADASSAGRGRRGVRRRSGGCRTPRHHRDPGVLST